MKALPVVIPEEDEDEEVHDDSKDDGQRDGEEERRPKTVRIAAESAIMMNEEGSEGDDFIHNSYFAQKLVGVKGGKKWRRTMHANNFLGDDPKMRRRTTAMV